MVILIIIAAILLVCLISGGCTCAVVQLTSEVRGYDTTPVSDITWLAFIPNKLVIFIDNFNDSVIKRATLPLVWITVFVVLAVYDSFALILILGYNIGLTLKKWLLYVKNG